MWHPSQEQGTQDGGRRGRRRVTLLVQADGTRVGGWRCQEEGQGEGREGREGGCGQRVGVAICRCGQCVGGAEEVC